MLLDELAAQKKGNHQTSHFIEEFVQLACANFKVRLLELPLTNLGTHIGNMDCRKSLETSRIFSKISEENAGKKILLFQPSLFVYVFSGLESKNKQNTDNIKVLQVGWWLCFERHPILIQRSIFPGSFFSRSFNLFWRSLGLAFRDQWRVKSYCVGCLWYLIPLPSDCSPRCVPFWVLIFYYPLEKPRFKYRFSSLYSRIE